MKISNDIKGLKIQFNNHELMGQEGRGQMTDFITLSVDERFIFVSHHMIRLLESALATRRKIIDAINKADFSIEI